ncbi:MAG: hypothetical protein Q9226_004220 [Calogaya cf. arnoldii]
MIEGGLTYNQQPRFQNLTEIPLHQDDPEALLILLHTAHSQFRKVPRKVDLKTLTQIAILVDKYELLELTELLVDNWLLGVNDTIPSELNDDLQPWICIAAVFERESILQRVSEVSTRESKGTFDASNLPIDRQVLSNKPPLIAMPIKS